MAQLHRARKAFLHAPFLVAALFFSAMAVADSQSPWQPLEPGFELAVFTPDSTAPIKIVVLRMDPEKVDFVLLSASEYGTAASLPEWAAKERLSAAINASMFLPDALTSTGYMRDGEHINNARVVSRFGAFFVAAPRHVAQEKGLPRAGVLDRDADPWEERLPLYNIVAQNYRLINASGELLWNPGGPASAVAAVAQNQTGHILFIHCREPMGAAEFGELLLTLPLSLRTVMYVEGGSQAGLLVRSGGVDEIWMGRHRADFFTTGNRNTPLPNVIGARPRADRREPASALAPATSDHKKEKQNEQQ